MPTAIWKSRLRSGSAHCNLEVAVEVRQCPLGSGARGGGPAVPTGIWTARRRTRRRWRRRRRRRRTALIKSNNPHLAGGKKSELRCGTKHISKSKCTKHLSVGPLLEVEMSKKCTPLWREAHFQVKMYKTPQPRSTFGS